MTITAESYVTKEGVTVKVGQIWKDLDPRVKERYLMVTELSVKSYYGGGRAREEPAVVAVRCDAGGLLLHARTSYTRVSLNRLRKTSTGYTLYKDVA